MGLFDRIRESVEGAIFISEDSTPTEEPVMSEEQLAGCEVKGDANQTAQNLLSEALSELDKAGVDSTILKIQEILDTWGADCSSTIVLKTLKVARIAPEVLQQDGEARIKKINGVMSMVDSDAEQVFEKATQTEKDINQAINDEESAYTADVDALNKQCEEDIKALREKLQGDILARQQKRDDTLTALNSQKAENTKEKDEADALKSAVSRMGTEQIDYINKLLGFLQSQQEQT